MSRIVYIGAPEADAGEFMSRLRSDVCDKDVFATNDRVTALQNLAQAEAIIGHHFQFDDDLLARAPNLRWIQSLTSGTDAILKLPLLRKNVLLTNTRGMHGPQMSELVFLHMLSLNRNFPRMLQNQAARRWERWPQPLLSGKTAVLVGIGAISETLAPRCKAFGMQVCGVTASPRNLPAFDRIFSRHELDKAASLADFLVIVVPHSADTESLINARILNAMKPSAYLINVARGGVLDEDALLEAIRRRKIAGAALDVFRRSPLPPDDPLWNESRILITPLVGGMSNVYLEQCYPIVLSNLKHYLGGDLGKMLNVVHR